MTEEVMIPDEVVISKIHLIRMREMLLNFKDLFIKLEEVEKKVAGHDEDIRVVFAYLTKLLPTPEQTERRRLGFRRGKQDD